MDDYSAIETPVDLREYLTVLKVRKWTVILIAFLVTAIILGLSYRQTPLYTAESRLLVTNFGVQFSVPNLETEGEVVSSVPVATLVRADLGTNEDPDSLLGGLSVLPSSDTGAVLNITYVSADPQLAQAAANSFAQEYINYKQDQQRQSIETSRATISQKMDRVGAQLKILSDRVERARRKGDTTLASILETRRTILISRLGVLQNGLDAIPAESSIATGGGEVIEPASLPSSPSSPNHRNDGVVGLMVGLIAGVGIAFIRDRLDDRFKGRTDVERTLQSPVLATIPRYSAKRHDGRSQLIVVTDPRGSASETYRGLRTNVQFLSGERGIKSLIVTSAAAGEGKSLTSVNLAVALAQTRARVILVSADLRRPTIESYFGLTNDRGLANWLSGEQESLLPLLREVDVPNLRVIPSGPVPPNPTELLASPRLQQLISMLEENADMVLFDSPPVLPVADTQIMATHTGGVILVIDSSKTHRSAGLRAKSEIERVGGRIIGPVLNSYDPESSPYYQDPSFNYYRQYLADPTHDGSGTARSRRKERRAAGKAAQE
jgi:succinoglycan biosynthesis transport protein ExoP